MTELSLGTCPNLVELELLSPALQTLDLKCVPTLRFVEIPSIRFVPVMHVLCCERLRCRLSHLARSELHVGHASATFQWRCNPIA